MLDESPLTAERAEHTARVLRALGNPQRLLILCRLLKAGEASAGDLAQRLGLSPSALSQHLARMREEALVQQRRDGRSLHYRINDQLDIRLPTLLESLCDEPAAGAASAEHLARAAAVVGLAFSSAMGAADDDVRQAPAVTAAGSIRPLPHAAYQPDPDAGCKAVFGMTRGSDDPGQINPVLQRVARAVDLYANAGVPPGQISFVAVASGAAIAIALDDTHYRQQYGVDNPNLPLIRQLRAGGVDVAVCGQAMAEHGYPEDWIDGGVTLALSALTTLTELQRKGYALVPL
ncbi:MAG TPA: metalloregulator ArsR/SmtB family transcription factor [Rhodanobacter sp.]|nr:metalloregulator ArsR/SmtB family transcription factor [Rhodanobacter sp.]